MIRAKTKKERTEWKYSIPGEGERQIQKKTLRKNYQITTSLHQEKEEGVAEEDEKQQCLHNSKEYGGRLAEGKKMGSKNEKLQCELHYYNIGLKTLVYD